MHNGTLLLIGNYLPSPRHNKNVWHYLAERLTEAGWEVITTSSKLRQILRLVDMLGTILREKNRYAVAQIDVFSGKAFIWSELCTCLLKHLNKPIILTLHGGGLPEFGLRYPKRIQRVLKAGKVVVTPSPFLQEALSQYRADIRLIPNPIDLSASIYRHREQAEAKLIWVRSFHEIYNPSLAVRVIKKLVEEFPDIQLVMVGPDKGDGSLEHTLSLVEELGVKERIEIIGSIPHTLVPEWLDKGDIFINTTNYDNTPSSLMEAMANGLCLVSTNVGGILWLVEDGKDALLVPPDDANAMAEAVRRVLTEPGLAGKLSEAGRRRAEGFDWSVILPQWETLFEEVIEVERGQAG